jgi:hypothetical protein
MSTNMGIPLEPNKLIAYRNLAMLQLTEKLNGAA